DREFPRPFSVNRSFQNILPQVMTTVRFSNSENLRFNYRTSTNAPSVNQLQDVVDNSNPLFLRTGNPDLEQTYGHNLSLRYSKSNIEKSTRSEEHTSELQSRENLVCRLLLEKKKRLSLIRPTF